jgi:hypothetical protein
MDVLAARVTIYLSSRYRSFGAITIDRPEGRETVSDACVEGLVLCEDQMLRG